jgi:hypothetical protein
MQIARRKSRSCLGMVNQEFALRTLFTALHQCSHWRSVRRLHLEVRWHDTRWWRWHQPISFWGESCPLVLSRRERSSVGARACVDQLFGCVPADDSRTRSVLQVGVPGGGRLLRWRGAGGGAVQRNNATLVRVPSSVGWQGCWALARWRCRRVAQGEVAPWSGSTFIGPRVGTLLVLWGAVGMLLWMRRRSASEEMLGRTGK